MANYYNNKYPKNYDVGEGIILSFSEPPPSYDEEEGPAPTLKAEPGKAQQSSNEHEETATRKSWWPLCRLLGLGEDPLKTLTNEKAALHQQVRDITAEKSRLERELREAKRERDGLKDAVAAANELAAKQRANIRSQDKVMGDMREEMGYLRSQIQEKTRAQRQTEETWREREKDWNTERGRWRRTLAGVATRNAPERARGGEFFK